MKYWLGPMFWDAKFLSGVWRPPDGVVGTIDMRSIPGHADAGFALFQTPDEIDLGSDYRFFGQGVITDIFPKEADRSVFASMLGMKTVDGDVLTDWLASALTLYSDPSGDSAVKPLLPNANKAFEIHLGGQLIWTKPWDLNTPEATAALALLQSDYQLIKVASQDGQLKDDLQHLRVLDALIEKYGGDEATFGELDATQLTHETTITETFPSAAPAFGGDLSWTEIVGDFANVGSNTGGYTGATQFVWARADSDLSSSDHTVRENVLSQLSFGSVSGSGPAARFDSSATTCYQTYLYEGSNDQLLYKTVAGATTQLDSVAVTITLPVFITISCNGSNIKTFQGAPVRNNITDTAISTGIRGGSVALQLETWASWSASDLAAAIQVAPLLQRARVIGAGLGL